jgi:excinuclease UvrABC nuclease subunit
MFAGTPEVIDLLSDAAQLDEALEQLPKGPAVFAIWPAEGEPYLGKTNVLSRRLKRLLRAASQPSRLLNLRGVATRVEYWRTASRLEGSLVLYEVAKRHLPGSYVEFLKLRMPAYVKLIQSNQFPRTQVTSRISKEPSQYYGPFRSRATAEEFEHGLLDLFQLRRCQEDLDPRPEHPGCIYGEMNMCLRPCQQVVGVEEYASEAARVAEFLATGGRRLLQVCEAARDRLSADMDFEDAARQHKRIERIEELLKLRDALAFDIERLHGVAVTASSESDAVKLWFVFGGTCQTSQELAFSLTGDKTVSLDHRLRELVATLSPTKAENRERQEHLALLARWFYSSWRDGEWIPFESIEKISYRKLTGAVSRMVAAVNKL